MTAAIKTESREVHLKSRPDGKPTADNFTLATTELQPIFENEILVRNDWMSVDPYMRGRMKDGDSYVKPFRIGEPLDGGCVGRVIESLNKDFHEGDYVLGNLGWREYWKSDGNGVVKIDPDLAPVQSFLGALGMTGMTAWVGLNRIAELKPVSTVFVSAASGAVGSIVCQIAKANDCTVIGSAGTPEKIKWLRDVANVDQVINYKQTADLTKALGDVTPDGVDVYFDNVGGEHLETALDHMNDFGRIVCCGMISTYNATEPPVAPRNLIKVIGKRIRIEGFIVRDYMNDRDKFQQDMSSLIREDKMHWEETITDGLENAADAFIGLFEGDNLGKSLVRIK
ncbi:UNVERIFIED_CONTAM: hypothetical protein GTU68_025406 [Idotea baltica]|nr:hypothetical protein [Idotea baltica]